MRKLTSSLRIHKIKCQQNLSKLKTCGPTQGISITNLPLLLISSSFHIKMNPENGEFCVDYPSNYSSGATAATMDIGLGYLEQGFPQAYSEAAAALDEMTQQQLDACNLNLLSLLNMPASNCSSSSNNFNSASAVFEPLQLHLNLTPQQSSLFQMGGYGVLTASTVDEYVYGGGGGGGKEPLRQPKNFVTERQRRQTFSDKFVHLRSILPNPNKNDRASIVGDAIEYIKELIRTVKELQILVEKKRCSRQRFKRYKATPTEDNGTTTTNAGESEQVDQSLRSSWLQRKRKDTEIDVRIVDDEVTIKVVQRKKVFNLLLCVSRTFDELQLDLQHVTGGHVGDYCSFLFNTKISEGSSLYASAIANKLIDVVDGQYAALQ